MKIKLLAIILTGVFALSCTPTSLESDNEPSLKDDIEMPRPPIPPMPCFAC
ncbi:hypothetical protein [uncultured Lacinutrix sp.]|uniref:hypothetical protein n=1 Tax=uncultured Lacinutrix sp. TaxID=574032 RepID=UPI00261C6120|nr:hypothetical protein [uncultured Lacinutrix sp.]